MINAPPTSIPWLFKENWNDYLPVTSISFKQHSRKIHELDSYTDSTEYWDSRMEFPIEDWASILKHLSKLHNHHHIRFNEIFELQIGLLNNCFYHPCSLCGNESGGTFHTIFQCNEAKHITHHLDYNISITHLVGNTLDANQYSQANMICRILIFFSKKCYGLRVDNTNFILTDDIIKNLLNQFSYENALYL